MHLACPPAHRKIQGRRSDSVLSQLWMYFLPSICEIICKKFVDVVSLNIADVVVVRLTSLHLAVQDQHPFRSVRTNYPIHKSRFKFQAFSHRIACLGCPVKLYFQQVLAT
jgi:hypothetical protein